MALTLSSTFAFAEVSTSDPLWDWKYDAVERLLLASGERAVSNTRPMSRIEMAKLVLKVSAKSEELGDYLNVLLRRLKEELSEEINGLNEGTSGVLSVKPLRWVRAKAVHSDSPVQIENDYGYKGGNLSIRGEASTSGTWGSIGYELRPQYNLYRDKEYDDRFDLHSGYLVVWLKNVEIEVGKDSMWWGPGRHGAWLLTNNSPAFDLIKISNANTTTPPWPLKFMGDTRFTAFLGRISEQNMSYIDNGISVQERREPLFGGFRLNFSPSRYIEFGASQAVQFIDRGGRGYSFDYLRRTFIPSWEDNEAEASSGPVANRLTSTDLTINFGHDQGFMKRLGLKGLKIYWEQGGETMGMYDFKLPHITTVSNLYGLYLDNGKTDFRVEYAFNYDAKGAWYNHYQFTEGYKNDGFYIGHNHSQSLFLNVSRPAVENVVASLYFERGQQNWGLPFEDTVGLSVDAFIGKKSKVKAAYEYMDSASNTSNNILVLDLLYSF